jgi:hypothetical protein
MLLNNYKPFWSETAIFLGSGATNALGIPTTQKMGKAIYKLSNSEESLEKRINAVNKFHGIESELECFLSVLGDNLNEEEFTFNETTIEPAKKITLDDFTDEAIKRRILQWKTHYDWNALRRVAKQVPLENDNYSAYLVDLYNMIDGSLLNDHGIRDAGSDESVFLYPHRLRAARNLLVLISNLMMACAYHRTKEKNKADFQAYIEFVRTLNELMQRETVDLQNLEYNKRHFYLMSYSIISFNFDPIFLWLRFVQNVESNKNAPHIGERNLPVSLYHDYAVFSVIKDSYSVHSPGPYNSSEGYYAVNETVARHINGTIDAGRLFRICKYYFVHGSSNIRECGNCGKMMLILGDWETLSDELFLPPPFKTNLFKRTPRTIEEDNAQNKGRYDAIQCPFCGSMTYAYNTKMIMQTAYKGGHTSFLEEIQRDAKVSLSGAKHVVLLGYQLPPDDAIWRSAISAKRNDQGKIYCSVVVGYKGEDRWIEGDELTQYLEEKKKLLEKKEWADYGINAIDSAIAIFGIDNIRAYTHGIPRVWCNDNIADKDKIKNLLYPEKIFPDGVVNMRIEDSKRI